MRKIKLVTSDNKILYEGLHPTYRQAIEYAIKNNVSLDGIDLSDTDLKHINMDGVTICNANFNGANLTGANMSEAEFTNCNFYGADLSNTCLCYSNLSKCNFKYTLLTGMDIAMTSFSFCYFQGLSALLLDYHKAFKLEGLNFTHFEKDIPFSSIPTIIKQGERTIIILGKVMFYSDIPHTFDYDLTSKSIIDRVHHKFKLIADS